MTLDEFDRHPVGAVTKSLRAEFARAAGPVQYMPMAPYFLHTVHPDNDFHLSSYYAVSGFVAGSSRIAGFEVKMGNGGYDDFRKRFADESSRYRLSATFWILPQEPDAVYLMGADKFECFDAAPNYVQDGHAREKMSDSVLAEMAQYIRRMDASYIVNFVQDYVDVWAASPEKIRDGRPTDNDRFLAAQGFKPDPAVKGTVSRHINTNPGWPAAYKPVL